MEHLTQQAIVADAEMQMLQRKGWMDMNQGSPLFEGLDHLEYLGVKELRFTFRVEPSKPGIWARIKKSYRCLFGKPEPVATLYSVAPNSQRETGFTVMLTVSRTGTKFEADATPNIEEKGEIYVTSLPA